MVAQVLKPWKTITLGIHGSVEKLKAAFGTSDCVKSCCADGLLDSDGFTIAPELTGVYLVKLTVSEMGFIGCATYGQIRTRAAVLGLKPCPAEVGPALRLIYTDQPPGEWLRIAMVPIADSHGRPGIFDVGCDGGKHWLLWNSGQPESRWHPDDCFVFVLPRK